MNLTAYRNAIDTMPVPKLTAFLKAVEDTVEIEGWAKLRAPEKRDTMMEAFAQSKELRKEFVAFFEQETGKTADFSEWETADLPTPPEAAPEPAPEATEATTEAAPETPASEPELPLADPAPEPPVDPEPAPAPEPAPEAPKATGKKGKAVATTGPNWVGHTPLHSAFVEGAFEQIVSDVAGLDAEASKLNLKDAEDKLEFEHIRIGALLSHIQKSQHYVTLGHDNLRTFLAAETGLQYRKAMYLIENYDAIRELGVNAADLKGVTWSALRHVTPILTKANHKQWLDAARSTTHLALIEMVATEKAKQAGALAAPPAADGTPAPLKVPSIAKQFSLNPDQSLTIDQALEKAKQEGNVDSNAAALDILAAAFIGKPPADSTVAAVMPDLSKTGFIHMLTKLRADNGLEGIMVVLEAIGETFPEVDISVAFPE